MPGYAAELNQVWTNLVENAAPSVPGDTRFVVRLPLEPAPVPTSPTSPDAPDGRP
ncbi:Uncharacterised protein [Mycobacteroides abscessus]|nr:Uncharacterised protein [Mycobacteroides abscessus]